LQWQEGSAARYASNFTFNRLNSELV